MKRIEELVTEVSYVIVPEGFPTVDFIDMRSVGVSSHVMELVMRLLYWELCDTIYQEVSFQIRHGTRNVTFEVYRKVLGDAVYDKHLHGLVTEWL